MNRRRIAAVGSNTGRAMSGNHPAGTAATPMLSPAWMLRYAPAQHYPWGGTATYQDLAPTWNSDGGLEAMTTPGGFGKVHAAGRP